jgi:GNAT superfamily N-acetyltransferase
MSGVQIAAADPGDAPELLGAYEWLFAPPGSRPAQWDPQAAAERLRRAAMASDAVVLVARADGAIVGICTTYLDLESVRFGRRAWVEDLAVHPERRSVGIGKGLLDAAKDWARDRGATHLQLESAHARSDAHRFYEREGPSWSAINFGWEL